MSIKVPVDELVAALEPYPWGYLVTVGAEGTAHLLAVPTQWRGESLVAEAGAGTRANAVARPAVTMVFPPADAHGYSLIVDGDAMVTDDGVEVRPRAAVLHRPAVR